LAYALSLLPDTLGVPHSIHIADGTYAEAIDIHRFRGNSNAYLSLIGNVTTPSNVLFTGSTTTTQFTQNTSVVVNASIQGSVYTLIQGLTLQGNGTPTQGLLVQKNQDGHLVWDRCNIQTSSGTYSIAMNIENAAVEFRGNCSILNWTVAGVHEYAAVTTYTVAGTMTVTGPGGANTAWGLNIAYGSSLIVQSANVNFAITGCLFGFQLGLHGKFQNYYSTGTITVSNPTTMAGSAGVQATDQSTWSAACQLTWTNLTNSANLNSLSYAESTGTRTFTSVGSATTSQNSVALNL
jgi:hypothetical protein